MQNEAYLFVQELTGAEAPLWLAHKHCRDHIIDAPKAAPQNLFSSYSRNGKPAAARMCPQSPILARRGNTFPHHGTVGAPL